jgi:hypothetical protein
MSFLVVEATTMYLASVEDKKIVGYFLFCHEMSLKQKLNI